MKDKNLPSQQLEHQPLEEKKEKTKEELFELRKLMMKSKVKRQQDNFEANATPIQDSSDAIQKPVLTAITIVLDKTQP